MNRLINEIAPVLKLLGIGFLCIIGIITITILSFYISFFQYVAMFLIIEFLFIGTYLGIKKINKGTLYKWYNDKGVILLSLFAVFITFSGFMIYYYGSSQDSFWYTPINPECKSGFKRIRIRSHADDLICIIIQGGVFWKLIGIVFLIMIGYIYIHLNKNKKIN